MSREQIFQALKSLQKESRAHAVAHHVQRSDARIVQRLNERAQVFVCLRIIRRALCRPVEYRMTRAWPVEQKWLDMRWETSQSQELTKPKVPNLEQDTCVRECSTYLLIASSSE